MPSLGRVFAAAAGAASTSTLKQVLELPTRHEYLSADLDDWDLVLV